MVRYKQALLKTRTQQLNRVASCQDEIVKASLEALITALDEQLEHIKTQIEALIEAHEDLRDDHWLIASIKGLGADMASLILAEVYDLPHYTSAKAVAAMCKLLHLVFEVVKNQTPFDPNLASSSALPPT